ncbi:MAG: hypothetical protein HQK79_21025 [Desulfobacterales bacterium]|nr:hypothetical protein [Desulfobacterales bacterium]
MRKKVILSVLLIIGLLVCGAAFGNESYSSPQKNSNPQPAKEPENMPENDKNSDSHQPPPQAYEDCKGKKAGDTVQHTTPEGIVAATCEDSPQGLVARPNQQKGMQSDGFPQQKTQPADRP